MIDWSGPRSLQGNNRYGKDNNGYGKDNNGHWKNNNGYGKNHYGYKLIIASYKLVLPNLNPNPNWIFAKPLQPCNLVYSVHTTRVIQTLHSIWSNNVSLECQCLIRMHSYSD